MYGYCFRRSGRGEVLIFRKTILDCEGVFCIGGRIMNIWASFLPGRYLSRIPQVSGRLADHCALIFSAARQNQSLTPIELANSRRKNEANCVKRHLIIQKLIHHEAK